MTRTFKVKQKTFFFVSQKYSKNVAGASLNDLNL